MAEPDTHPVSLPFLLVSIRAEAEAAADEHRAVLRLGGLAPEQLVVLDVHRQALPELDLAQWSGIIVGGGPWNAGDPVGLKSPRQRTVEAWLWNLLDEVVERDVPFLGCCYGVGLLALHQGGTVDRAHPEAVGPVAVSLSAAGEADPLLAGLPRDFAAYGGHKESVARLPDSAVVLAVSQACPVQAFRVGEHVYAMQFHPELDTDGVCTRIEVYRNAGYFPPGEAEALKAYSRSVEVRHPMRILAHFVQQHRRPAGDRLGSAAHRG